jgi:hypothetical protein
MRIRFPQLLLTASVALMATGTVQAHGQGRPAPPAAATTDPGNPRLDSTLPDSVRRVERQTGGEVLRAEPMQQDGHEIYRLKVLTRDGRVRVMQADPSQPVDEAPANIRKHKPDTSDQADGGSDG